MSSGEAARHADGDLPGNPMMWVLIASEIAVFGLALAGFQLARVFDPELFAASQARLDPWAGTANTAVLLTSGYLAAVAVRYTQASETGRSRLFLLLAAALGCLFLYVKLLEYGTELQAGFTIDTNTFFTLYYLITGFHALHVVFGIILLFIAIIWNSLENAETITAFWHMVDLVWVLVFPVVYLAP
ncbi:MAG: cytochrome c oxidase subunit 3 [Rhodobiaceae bacterium]|nr:cytochrome c oxidase subunit 3 [Rhodobiaceae bacterium]MCC0051729.1 cytochrome c oxidase subunit 3 [Rhodobiaceae bacterium]